VHCLPRLLRAQLQLLEHAAGALEDPRVEATHYEAGILVAELLGDHRAQALFLLGLTDRYIGNFDMDMTLARLERAAAAAGQTDDRVLQLRIANRRAEVFLAAGDVNKAGRWSRIAMEIVDVDDADPAVQCHIMGVRLRCLSLSGQLGEARLLHEQAKDVAAKCPVVHRNSYLSGIAYLAALGGDPQRAIPEIVEALSELQDENLPRLMLTPLHNLGDLQLRNEQLEEAGQAFREVIRLGGLYGSDYHVHFNRGFLGYVLARQGDVEEGAAMLAEARDAVALMPGQHLAWQQLRLLDAEVAHMFGQSSRARRELEEMLADFHTSHEVSLAHWAQEALARIERDLGANFIEAPLGIDQAGSDPEQDTVRTKPVG
jgi:tetratricopeptide (TPR) repeat protein